MTNPQIIGATHGIADAMHMLRAKLTTDQQFDRIFALLFDLADFLFERIEQHAIVLHSIDLDEK